MNRPDLVVHIPYGRRETHYPIVLSVDETLAILAALRSLRDRVVITVLYSAGLRLGEACRLTVADIDSPRMLLHIRQVKGHKDRYAPLSPIDLDLLREWWRQTMRGTLARSQPASLPSMPARHDADPTSRRSPAATSMVRLIMTTNPTIPPSPSSSVCCPATALSVSLGTQ